MWGRADDRAEHGKGFRTSKSLPFLAAKTALLWNETSSPFLAARPSSFQAANERRREEASQRQWQLNCAFPPGLLRESRTRKPAFRRGAAVSKHVLAEVTPAPAGGLAAAAAAGRPGQAHGTCQRVCRDHRTPRKGRVFSCSETAPFPQQPGRKSPLPLTGGQRGAAEAARGSRWG